MTELTENTDIIQKQFYFLNIGKLLVNYSDIGNSQRDNCPRCVICSIGHVLHKKLTYGHRF